MTQWVIIAIVFLTAPVWVGVGVGIVIGTVKGIVHSIRKPEAQGKHAAEKPNQRAARSMATELRHREKVDSNETWEPGRDEGNSIMDLSEEEIQEFSERVPF